MTCPLTSNNFRNLEVVRNRMLRSIVGWAPLVDNDWHALMQKMNKKLEKNHGLRDCWLENFVRIASAVNSWASITSEWYPYQRWKMNYCDFIV